MYSTLLQQDVRFVKGVGEKKAQLLQKLQIKTLGDLIEFLPRGYEDWTPVPIDKTACGQLCCIRARLCAPVKESRVRGGRLLCKTAVTDGWDEVVITFFNNPYVKQSLREETEYLFYGRMSGNLFSREMVSPAFRKVTDAVPLQPIYPLTAGLTSRAISKMVRSALDALKDEDIETLPRTLREQYGLCGKYEALCALHFPVDQTQTLEPARRMSFEELLLLQLGLMQLRAGNFERRGIVLGQDHSSRFLSQLPFPPTNAQRRVCAQICDDMRSGKVMSRLVQGDVGSGKTAVAAAAVYDTVKNGYQAALMAPTEILAEQHFATFTKFFAAQDVRVALLTGSTPAAQKRAIKQQLAQGELDLIIGTHALLTADVQFADLALVITDEQHRFGVAQRAALSAKGNPHVLVLSATPIPRTLSLIIYGDLDLSLLDELPPGRKPIETYVIDSAIRQRAYGYIRKYLDAGRQGYIVCPLVEESDSVDLAAAEEYYERLQREDFSGYRVGLLHGKMKPKEKEETMRRFASGEIQLLVATTVIEVGVDVPNACIMLIEDAERFGLSALHQLRGRIGRGNAQSTCILLSDAKGDSARRRLEIMRTTADGFKIADEDLKMRGPGDFFGSRQHGLPAMHVAQLMQDGDAVRSSNQCAKEILAQDPALTSRAYERLGAQVKRLFSESVLSIN